MKTMKPARALLLGASIAFASTGAVAQTVGEILDKGGQKLDAAATRTIIVSGVTLSGTNAAGFVGTNVFKADGTLASSGTRPRDNYTNTGSGSWTIDDTGKVCTKIQWSGGGTGGGCHVWFKQGDSYYTAASDDRNVPAIARTIPR